MSFLTHLECPECERDFLADVVQNLCPCGAPLSARYDLKRAAAELAKEELAERPPSLWRYQEFLPVIEPENMVSLGEGFTPLIQARHLGRELGLGQL